MSQLVTRKVLRALLVRSGGGGGGGNCNMFVRSVFAASVIAKPRQTHDRCGGFCDFKIGSKHVQGVHL